MAEISQINGVWEAILWAIAWVLEKFYLFAQDWGLAIILFTIVFRVIMMPLMKSQTKSTVMMQRMQPKMKAIQEKFADDPVRMQQETQKMYADAKFNPLMGCIPLFIQMPIFIALFQVLRNIQDWLPYYENFSFYNIIADLLMTPSEAFAIDFVMFIPYLILVILFAGTTFLPMLLQQRDNTDQQQKNQMYMMTIIMSLMMLFISWSSPAGVLLFWSVSGIIAVIFQQTYTRYLKNKLQQQEEEAIEVKPVKVEVERREKKKRPTKKR